MVFVDASWVLKCGKGRENMLPAHRFASFSCNNRLTLLLAGGFRSPLQSFPISSPNAGGIELKLSDFVGTFIAHILPKMSGQVRSRHQNRSRDPTSRVLSLKFESQSILPNTFKLSEFCKCKCNQNLYLSDFLYRWPEVRSLRWPPQLGISQWGNIEILYIPRIRIR